MRSKTFKTYLNVCLYKKRCGRYNILSRYFAGEKERISAKRKSVRYRKAAVRSCRDFQKGDLMYRHKTKKYRAAAVGAVLHALLQHVLEHPEDNTRPRLLTLAEKIAKI